MRFVLLSVFVLVAVGCGGEKGKTGTTDANSEEKELRAKYVEYLDLRDKAGKMEKVASADSKAEDERRRQAGLPSLMPHEHPPHPLDGEFRELRKRLKSMYGEFGNRWKSLGLTVEQP